MISKKIVILCFSVVFLVVFSNLWSQSLVSIKTVSKEKKAKIVAEETKKRLEGESAFRTMTIEAKAEVLAEAILRAEAEAEAQIPTLEPGYDVLLSTELRDVIGNKKAGQAAFGTASFGIRRTSPRSALSLLIKVADSQAPITANCGRALLNPGGLERAAGYIDFAFFFSKIDFCMFRAYGTISTNDWQMTDTITGNVTSAQATILSLGIGAYKTIWDEQIEKVSSEIVSNLFLGITSRYISGDLAFKTNDDLRSGMLGLGKKFFPGFEFYWDILFSGIKGFADITWFPHQIPGFSSLRLTAGIGFQAEILKFRK